MYTFLHYSSWATLSLVQTVSYTPPDDVLGKVSSILADTFSLTQQIRGKLRERTHIQRNGQSRLSVFGYSGSYRSYGKIIYKEIRTHHGSRWCIVFQSFSNIPIHLTGRAIQREPPIGVPEWGHAISTSALHHSKIVLNIMPD